MILRLCFLGSFLIITDAFQIFGRSLPILQFGFDIPGFTDPSAFGPVVGNIEERVDGIMNGMGLKPPGMSTKVKDEKKGNMKIHTVEKNGKGYHSYSRLMTFDDTKNGTRNGTKFGKNKYRPGPFGAFGPFGDFGSDLIEEFAGEDETPNKKEKTCSGSKQCKGEKYCDPLQNVCKDRLDEGETCTLKDQCKKGKGNGIICIWGKCSEGKPGEPGCFCKKNLDCGGDACCNLHSDISNSYPICTPKLGEGATCGQSNPLSALTDFFGVKKIESDEIKSQSCNPCRTGLKCAVIGSFGRKVCVPADLKEKPTKPDKEKSKFGNAKDEDDDKEDEDKSGDGTSAEGPTDSHKAPGSDETLDKPVGGKKPSPVKPVPPINPPSVPQQTPPTEPQATNPEKPKPNPNNNQNPNSRPNPNGVQQQPTNQNKPPTPQVVPAQTSPGKKPRVKRPKKKLGKNKEPESE